VSGQDSARELWDFLAAAEVAVNDWADNISVFIDLSVLIRDFL